MTLSNPTLHSVVICSCFVDIWRGPEDPRDFPQAWPCPGSPFPVEAPLGCEFAPRGRLRGQPPPTVAVLRRTLTSDVRFGRSLSSANRETGCSLPDPVSCPPRIRLSPWSDERNHGPGACCAVPPRNRLCLTDTSDLSCSLGTPLEVDLVLRPRRARLTRSLGEPSWSAEPLQPRTHDTALSGVNCQTLPVAAGTVRSRVGFAVALAERPRKTRFRPAGQHDRVGLSTHWVPSNGFWSLPVAIPPFQSETGRKSGVA